MKPPAIPDPRGVPGADSAAGAPVAPSADSAVEPKQTNPPWAVRPEGDEPAEATPDEPEPEDLDDEDMAALKKMAGIGVIHLSPDDDIEGKTLLLCSPSDAALMLGLLDRSPVAGVDHVRRAGRIMEALAQLCPQAPPE